MKPIEILLKHRDRVQGIFSEVKSWPKTYEMLKSEFPEFSEMSFPTFKQYSTILLEINKMLNSGELLNSKLNNDAALNSVKQELENVKQELNRLNLLNTELNNTIESLNSGKMLNMINKEDSLMDDKQPINISGWSVIKFGRYFRAFRRFGRKMHGVYLGKTLEGAEQKIQAKQLQLAGGEPC